MGVQVFTCEFKYESRKRRKCTEHTRMLTRAHTHTHTLQAVSHAWVIIALDDQIEQTVIKDMWTRKFYGYVHPIGVNVNPFLLACMCVRMLLWNIRLCAGLLVNLYVIYCDLNLRVQLHSLPACHAAFKLACARVRLTDNACIRVSEC